MSAGDQSDVSAIIPVYNCEQYLAEAIESVLAQTVPCRELIVIDDGSTDGTAEVCRAYGDAIVYRRQDNGGTGAARNHGVRMAGGELLAFLDADDLWLPDKLASQLAELAADPTLDCVFGQADQFYCPQVARDGEVAPPLRYDDKGVLPSSLLLRRAAFERVGPFDETPHFAEWPDWYMRAAERGLKMKTVAKRLARRRLHPGNKGRVDEEAKSLQLRALRAMLKRRRAASRSD